MKQIIGHEVLNDQYHVGIIREKLTRMLPVIVPDLVDELRLAVSDCIPTKGDGEGSLHEAPADVH